MAEYSTGGAVIMTQKHESPVVAIRQGLYQKKSIYTTNNSTPQPSVNIFELLLCRILALGGAGLDYSSELADARTLAGLREGGVQ